MNTAQRAQLAVAWFTMFVVGTELFVLSPLLPQLAADYHISAGTAGLAVTIFSLSYAACAPLFGHAADRIGRRRVLTVSLCAFAAANALTALATNLPALLFARFFAGAAAAGISPSVYALIGAAAPAERRGSWLAVVVSGLLVSLACGASPSTLVGAAFGWHTIFFILACLGLLLAGLNRMVWSDETQIVASSTETAGDRRPLALLSRRLIPTVLWSTGLYGVYTYLGAGLVAIGFSAGQTAEAVLCYGCGAITGALIGSPIADRWGCKFTAGVSLAGLSAGLFLLRIAFDTRFLVAPALAVSAAVAQLFFPAQQAGLTTDFPHRRGTAMAWNNSALFLGISLGSLIGAEALALRNFDANLTICAGIALIGWIINALVVPGRQSQTVF